MTEDDSPTTSKDDPSRQELLSAEERWAERMKPSRQRNLTQSQRDSLARRLRACRKAHFLEMQSGLTETWLDRTGRNAGSIFSHLHHPWQENE
jgi:hypothetical protein